MSLVENDLKTESDQSEGVKTSGFIVYGATTVLWTIKKIVRELFPFPMGLCK